MLEHWIQPLSSPVVQESSLSGDRIGAHLEALEHAAESSDQRAVALIGADSRWTKFVRRHLYKFTHRMPEIRLHDLGDLRRVDPDFVTGPILELLSSGICPVLIGGHLGLVKAFRQSYLQLQRPFKPCVMHESVPESIAAIPDTQRLIGVQQHLLPKIIPTSIHAMHLSHLRNGMSNADTMMRESNFVAFDVSALSVMDLPAQRAASASGLTIEEACTLMRFAGLHSAMQSVFICGQDPMSMQLDQSANVVAQMIWYFLEAYSQCIIEDPARHTHYTTYAVHLESYDTDLKFYKSERTGRWWVQFPPAGQETLFPCTYQDYHGAVNGQVTDRLIACASESMEGSKQ